MKKLLLPVICAILTISACKKTDDTITLTTTYNANAFTEKGCNDPGMVKSINSINALDITFINNSKREVTIIWINYSGGEQPYKELTAGQTWVCPTFLTHPWMIRKADNSCATIITPKAGASANETVTLTD